LEKGGKKKGGLNYLPYVHYARRKKRKKKPPTQAFPSRFMTVVKKKGHGKNYKPTKREGMFFLWPTRQGKELETAYRTLRQGRVSLTEEGGGKTKKPTSSALKKKREGERHHLSNQKRESTPPPYFNK